MKVLLDIDNTVGNYTQALRRSLSKLLNIEDSEENFPNPQYYSYVQSGWKACPSEKTYRSYHSSAVDSGMFVNMDVYPGASLALRRAMEEAGAHIIVATSRFVRDHAHVKVMTDTIHWLNKKCIPVHEIAFTNNKENVNGDIAIDDAPHNIEMYAKRGIPVIVFAQEYNKEYDETYPNVVLRTDSWDEIGEYLVKFPSQVA